MQLISCHSGKLQTLSAGALKASSGRVFRTGLEALDGLAPAGAFACGTVHELLSRQEFRPLFVALLLAKGAASSGQKTQGGPIVWCDPKSELYPPALAAAGVSLRQLFLLRPQTPADQIWAIAECLGCKGVGATVATLGKLSRIEARRLQLSAERGGGVGILLRPMGTMSANYAATTRWLVEPAAGERTVQRWKIQLLHGHGGRIGQTVFLEVCRETDHVRAVESLEPRSRQAADAAARATG